MSRRARVLNHGRLAGDLVHRDGRYVFTYSPEYVLDADTYSISLTLPKRTEPYDSEVFFPFFYGLISEGSTRALQARILKIDEDDYFGLLVATGRDTVGSVSIEEAE